MINEIIITETQNNRYTQNENFSDCLISIFEGEEFGYFSDGVFVANDACKILEYADPDQAIRKLDNDEKLIRTIYRSGQNRQMWCITESGLYSLILRSRKAKAKRLKKFVTSKILPEIRATGSYNSAPQLTTKEILQIALRAEEERETLLQLTTQQNQVIQELKPVAEFVESTFKASKTSIYIGEFAKIHGFIYPTGQKVSYKGKNGIFELLRGEVEGYRHIKYLAWNNVALAKYDSNHGNGYFEVKEYEESFAPSSRITPKGQAAVFKKFAENGIHPESSLGV
ncbi:MAG: hypothetical protein A2287_00580 [Candidatus Melainabacteria bacterium RIFOXYA12_FULL_32_12]|nr:MAG: hypothetical protein A2287_00580 [Candidatus Melainabacteria bacterium RIFOXYA12_FULL_32_12]